MRKFLVVITESKEYSVRVEAETKEEAIDKVHSGEDLEYVDVRVCVDSFKAYIDNVKKT